MRGARRCRIYLRLHSGVGTCQHLVSCFGIERVVATKTGTACDTGTAVLAKSPEPDAACSGGNMVRLPWREPNSRATQTGGIGGRKYTSCLFLSLPAWSVPEFELAIFRTFLRD